MISTSYEEKINDGWVLYYSEEGYPYYYKESTGESEWAPVTDDDGNPITYDDGWQYSAEQPVVEDEESSQEGSSDDTGSSDSEGEDEDSDEGSSEQSAAGSLDKALEEKFKEYLQTPEGIAAAEAEFERLGRKLDKRLAKRSSEADQAYVRGLGNRKKDNNGPAYDTTTLVGNVQAITNKVVETTNAWMFPVQNAGSSSKTKKQGGATSSATATASSSGKYDAADRATKHRRANNSAQDNDARMAAVESGAGRSPNSSRSSSISSETESFSSDDSDVKELDAPLFSEVPNWLSLQSISNAWVGALTAINNTVAPMPPSATATPGIGNAESAAMVHAADNISNSLSVIAPNTVVYLQESSLYAARQGFYIIGGAFVQGFSVLFEHLNPVLESFVESLVDTSSHRIVRAARTGTSASAAHNQGRIENTTSVVDVEQRGETRSSQRSARSSRSSARSHPQPTSSRVNVLSSRTNPRPDLPPPTPPSGRDTATTASPRVSAGVLHYPPAVSPPAVTSAGRRSASSTPRTADLPLPVAITREMEGARSGKVSNIAPESSSINTPSHDILPPPAESTSSEGTALAAQLEPAVIENSTETFTVDATQEGPTATIADADPEQASPPAAADEAELADAVAASVEAEPAGAAETPADVLESSLRDMALADEDNNRTDDV